MSPATNHAGGVGVAVGGGGGGVGVAVGGGGGGVTAGAGSWTVKMALFRTARPSISRAIV